ncbi:MAG: hypothetical protein ACYST0_01270 [Planctomycetota bacterium]|jgi:hypothetical protein
MKPPAHISLAALACILTACHHGHGGEPVRYTHDRPVAIEVEVYDPTTNFVWENVGVRLVQADQEWSGCICSNPDREDWYYTDKFGTVFFSPKDIADADIGFKVDESNQAVISQHRDEDQATVLLEVWSKGFRPVLWEVKLTYDKNDVFVSIPFE